MGNSQTKKQSETVLITGATGFTGANLAIKCVQEGYDLHILTRETSNRWRLSAVLDQLTDHVVDLREWDKLKRTVIGIKPDVVFHLATAGIYGGISMPERDVIDVNMVPKKIL